MDMNYETFIKDGQHLKTLLKLTKLTKWESTSARKYLEHLLDGHIFHSPLGKSLNIAPSPIKIHLS